MRLRAWAESRYGHLRDGRSCARSGCQQGHLRHTPVTVTGWVSVVGAGFGKDKTITARSIQTQRGPRKGAPASPTPLISPGHTHTCRRRVVMGAHPGAHAAASGGPFPANSSCDVKGRGVSPTPSLFCPDGLPQCFCMGVLGVVFSVERAQCINSINGEKQGPQQTPKDSCQVVPSPDSESTAYCAGCYFPTLTNYESPARGSTLRHRRHETGCFRHTS